MICLKHRIKYFNEFILCPCLLIKNIICLIQTFNISQIIHVDDNIKNRFV